MTPALMDGDRVLCVPWGRPRPGDLVAARDPRQPGRVLVKRVAARSRGGLVLHGDNPSQSTDSRHFGPVPERAVLGRVVYRYAPPGQAGRLGRDPFRLFRRSGPTTPRG